MTETFKNSQTDNEVFEGNGATFELAIPTLKNEDLPIFSEAFLGKLGLMEEKVNAYLANLPKVDNLSIGESKTVRTDLNFLIKNLNDGRIAMKKQWDKSISPAELKIKSIQKQVELIKMAFDDKIHASEEAEREEIKKKLEEYYKTKTEISQLVEFDKIYLREWTNKTFGLKEAKEAIDEKVERIKDGLIIIYSAPINKNIVCKMFCIFNFLEIMDHHMALENTRIFSETLKSKSDILYKIVEGANA